jgi:xylan 1,4-beta-xylosidase
MKQFTLDYASERKPLPHFWEECIGVAHTSALLRADCREHILRCKKDLGFRYVRLGCSFGEDAGVVSEVGGDPEHMSFRFSFTNLDTAFDFLLGNGLRPYITFGSMPKGLASGNTMMGRSNSSPPKDYVMWRWLVEQATSHWVERYGLGEVRQWYFEVWNEPNIGAPNAPMGFWGGSREEYFKLFEYASRGVKSVDARLRIGGPTTSANAWIPEFVEYCRTNKVPVDYISTHHYPTDDIIGLALKKMMEIGVKARKGEADQAELQAFMKEYEDTKQNAWNKVPRGTLTEMTRRTILEADGLPVYYSEWSSWSGLPSDGPFGASFAAKTIMDTVGLVDLYCYWIFSDLIGNDDVLAHPEFHGEMGLLTAHGIPKAPYRAFQLLHELGSELYVETYKQGTVDIYAVYKSESNAIQFLAVNHQSLRQEIQKETVSVKITGLPSFTKAEIKRVDENNGNALKRFEELGSPQQTGETTLYALLAASVLNMEKLDVKPEGDTVEFSLELPEQGIALVTLYI